MAKNVVDEARVVVRPDTTGFAKELKAKLAQINEDLKVQAHVDLDLAKAKAELEKFSKNRPNITADVKPDTAKASSALNAWGVKESGDLDIKPSVKPQTKKASGELDAWEKKESAGLKVKGDIDIKTEMASAALKAWRIKEESKDLKLKVQVDRGTIGGKLPSINAHVNLKENKATAEYLAWVERMQRHHINTKVNVDRRPLQHTGSLLMTLGRLGTSIGGIFGGLGKIFTGMGRDAMSSAMQTAGSFQQMGSTAVSSTSEAFSGFGKMGSGAAGAAGAVGGLISSVISATLTILKLTAIIGGLITLITLLGGVITALSGSIVALSAAVPALTFGVAAGIGAVMLGLDGIKRAAATIKDEFNKLKASVSATFQTALTPLFQQLVGFFPLIAQGANNIASGMASLASQMITVLQSKQGMADLRNIFAQMGSFLAKMGPALSRFLGVMVHLGASNAAWQFLSNLLSGVLDKISRLFEKLQSTGLLSQALGALNSVLQAAVQFMMDFAYYATEFFTAAAPGLTEFWRGFGAFLSKFDWGYIGSMFGSLFGAIGDGFAKIPKSTIKEFQNAMSHVIDVIRRFIEDGGLDKLMSIASKLVQAFGNLISIGGHFIDVIYAIFHPIDTLKGMAGSLGQGISNLGKKFLGMGNNSVRGHAQAEGAGRHAQSAFHGIGDSIYGSLSHAGKEGGSSLAGGVAEGTATAKTHAGELPGALGKLLHVDLSGNGSSIMNSFWDGMKSIWGSVTGWVSGLGSWIAQNKGPISYDKRLLIPAGKAIMGGLLHGLLRGWSQVQSMVTSVSGLISSALASPGSVSMNTGVSGRIAHEFNSSLDASGLNTIDDRIETALSNWSLEMNSKGIVHLYKQGSRLQRNR